MMVAKSLAKGTNIINDYASAISLNVQPEGDTTTGFQDACPVRRIYHVYEWLAVDNHVVRQGTNSNKQ